MIEALVALVLVSIGLVLGAEQLKPISWSVWAGQIEKEGGMRNPYRKLEERPGFMDIRVSQVMSGWQRVEGFGSMFFVGIGRLTVSRRNGRSLRIGFEARVRLNR